MAAPQSNLPTVADVAVAAGVSTATVSRALNRPEAVRPALLARVHRAIGELGYVPHAGARALMLGRTGTVGVIVPTVDNAIFATAINAMQQRLEEAGMHLVIATSDYDPGHELRQAVNLVARGVDGLVLCGAGQRPELLHLLRQRGLPWVHGMVHTAPDGALSVGFDNAAAMALAVRYLLDLGHRRFAMLAGITRHNDRARARLQGVRSALHAAGVQLPDTHVIECPYDLAAARDGLRELLLPNRKRQNPTALLCGNDVLAVGAVLEAQRLGVAVPAQLSVVGFDDLDLARHMQPALTTLRVPAQQMWRCAIEQLLAALQGGSAKRPAALTVDLVVRESTGPAAPSV